MGIRPSQFFLVAVPGLEDLVAAEFQSQFPYPVQCQHGGVLVEAPREMALLFNQVLKTPTRILWRVDEFRVRDFPTLFKKMAAYPWSEWLDERVCLDAVATSRLSRLKIKKRIEETACEGFAAYQKTRGIKPDKALRVDLYLRLHSDQCTISLDTSGDRLHKRGERRLIGEAPLRETFAAISLEWMAREFPETESVEIVDPMAGSGVFLIEALRRGQPNLSRGFSAELFKDVVQERDFSRYLRPPKIHRALGIEADPQVVKVARANLKKETAELIHADIFSIPSVPPSTERVPRWVLANPPYGQRLKVSGDLNDYYARLFEAVERTLKPQAAVFILPSRPLKGRLKLPLGWKVHGKRPFLNGGLPVVGFLFKVNR